MSINDPQWGNSHRPEKKEPEQVPEVTGTEPVQPQEVDSDAQLQKTPVAQPPSSPRTPPPEGPPDLEELWQRWVYQTRCKLARVFGKEPPPRQLPTIPPSSNPVPGVDVATGWQALSFKSWLIGVLLIIGAWLVSGFYLVDAQQRGIVSRFGAVMRVEDPGWHWRWPYPIDGVRLVNVAADRTLEVGLAAQNNGRSAAGLMLTSDGNLVGVSYAIVYQVADPVAYVAQADAPVDLLALLAESAVRDVVNQQTLTGLLSASAASTTTTGQPLLQQARYRLQTALAPFAIGIVVKDLAIREVQLPGPVLQAVKEMERQEQASSKALRESQVASTERLIKARKLAAKLQDESSAYARAVENTAETLRNAARPDQVEAQQWLADQAGAWRQQYPLVFTSLADLQARVQPKAAGRSADAVSSKAAGVKAAPEVSDKWRDREWMRTRDRVDRPGGGS